MNKLTLGILATSFLFACQSKVETEKTNTEETKVEETAVVEETESTLSAEEVEALIKTIDKQRTAIEGNLGEATELKTDSLRAKIKQKWSKIDYYTNQEGAVVRIKTYPHAEVSKRTEEFYLADGSLILAVIEDNGEGERGKEKESIDKMYYFNEGEMIKEIAAEGESEYSIKNLDAEELQAEVQEYLDLFESAK
jgi:hypothetical protein